jgi:hypothetical protein
MRTGMSRRQWLAGLLAALSGPWLGRLLPASLSGVAPTPGPPVNGGLRAVSLEGLGTVTTYT